MKGVCRARSMHFWHGASPTDSFLPVHFFFPQRQLDEQALWIFNQKVEKLSAMRHHLLWPFWPCFLSSLAMPDKPLEGLSAYGNGWAVPQRTQGVRGGLNHERTAWRRRPSRFASTLCWAVKGRGGICSSFTRFLSFTWSLRVSRIVFAFILADRYPSLPHNISVGVVLCWGVPEGHLLIGCSWALLSHLCARLVEFVMMGTKSLTSHWLDSEQYILLTGAVGGKKGYFMSESKSIHTHKICTSLFVISAISFEQCFHGLLFCLRVQCE